MATASAPSASAFRHVAAVANTAGVDQRDVTGFSNVVQRAARLANCGDTRYAGLFSRQVGAGAGAALHAVHVDRVRIGLGRHAHIVVDTRRAQLQLNGNLSVGGLADLLNLSAPGRPDPSQSGWRAGDR